MKTQPLHPQTPVTQKGDLPSADLVLLLQQYQRAFAEIEQRLKALEP